MKRIACILCLLVPLVIGAAAPGRDHQTSPVLKPGADARRPAPSVVVSDRSAVAGALPSAAIGRAAAAQLLASGWPGQPLPRQSIEHVDLMRSVQLALVTRPQWETDPQGRSRLNVGILNLRW